MYVYTDKSIYHIFKTSQQANPSYRRLRRGVDDVGANDFDVTARTRSLRVVDVHGTLPLYLFDFVRRLLHVRVWWVGGETHIHKHVCDNAELRRCVHRLFVSPCSQHPPPRKRHVRAPCAWIRINHMHTIQTYALVVDVWSVVACI